MFNYEESKTKAFDNFCEGVDKYVNEVDKTDGKYVDKDLLDNAIYDYETDMDIITKSYGIEMYNDGFKKGRKAGIKNALIYVGAALALGTVAVSVYSDIKERGDESKKK